MSPSKSLIYNIFFKLIIILLIFCAGYFARDFGVSNSKNQISVGQPCDDLLIGPDTDTNGLQCYFYGPFIEGKRKAIWLEPDVDSRTLDYLVPVYQNTERVWKEYSNKEAGISFEYFVYNTPQSSWGDFAVTNLDDGTILVGFPDLGVGLSVIKKNAVSIEDRIRDDKLWASRTVPIEGSLMIAMKYAPMNFTERGYRIFPKSNLENIKDVFYIDRGDDYIEITIDWVDVKDPNTAHRNEDLRRFINSLEIFK